MANKKDKDQAAHMAPRLLWIVVTLILLGLGSTGARIWLFKAQPDAEASSAWSIDFSIRLQAAKPGAEIDLAPPWDTPGARLYSQQLTLDGLRLRRTKIDNKERRHITMVGQRAGKLGLEAEFSIHRFVPNHPRRAPKKVVLEPDERQRLLGKTPGIDPRAAAVETALGKIVVGKKDPNSLIQGIYDYVRDRTAYSNKKGASTASAAITSGRANDLGRARAMVALCRAAQLPARLITGFVLVEQRRGKPVHWVQVYDEHRWRDFDPTQGFFDRLPDNYVTFSRDGPLIELQGASIVSEEYQVSETDIPRMIGNGNHRNPLTILNLARLPLSARATLAILLLLPLGALLNTFVRSIVGVQTFGTFTPAMLALAAIYVDWITATVIFTIVAVVALVGRSRLPGLQLARAPRLTIVFALVALAMALAVSLMAYFDLLTGTQVILLPIVILTSLVDRIYSVADEQGLHSAIIRLLWTGFTAIGCFFILTATWLGEWLVDFPEMHLVTIALILILAAYRGPTLTRFPGLRWLGTPTRKSDKSGDEE